jgi:hypothetical protein
MRKFTFLFCLILTACGGGGGSGGVTPSISSNSCERFTYVLQGQYAAGPDVWGLDYSSNQSNNYSACVTITSNGQNTSAVSSWDFGSMVGNPVIAFPSVYYGAKVGSPVTVNSVLPKQINQINSFVVSWNYNLTHGQGLDSGDVIIDNWLTTIPNATGYTPSEGMAVEIMIFLENWGSNWATYYLNWPIVSIEGIQYYFQATLEQNNILAVSLFPVNNLSRNSSLDLAPILKYLIDNNIVPDNLYFADTEFGTEINRGSGQHNITSYSVSVQ